MFKLDDSLGYLLNAAAVSMRWALEARLAPHGVTAPQWAVLARLWEEDGLPQSRIGERLSFDKPTVSGVVDRLEDKGLVRRVRDEQDRRVTRVFLTEAGRGLRDTLVPLAEEVNGLAAWEFSPEELAALKSALVRLRRSME